MLGKTRMVNSLGTNRITVITIIINVFLAIRGGFQPAYLVRYNVLLMCFPKMSETADRVIKFYANGRMLVGGGQFCVKMRRSKVIWLVSLIFSVMLAVDLLSSKFGNDSITTEVPQEFDITADQPQSYSTEEPDDTEFTCWRDFVHPTYTNSSEKTVTIPTFCRPLCPQQRMFSLPGMSKCRKWLTCDDLKDITNRRPIGVVRGPGVKNVELASWLNSWTIVVTTPQRPRYNWLMEILLDFYIVFNEKPTVEITQFLGNCSTLAFFELNPLGSLNRVDKTMQSTKALQSYDTFPTRFRMCYHLARCFQFLLHTEFGPRVLGDIDDFDKGLSQFLITSDLKVILNDYDLIPPNGSDVYCHPHSNYSTDSYFVAPEANCEILLRKNDTNEDGSITGYLYHQSNIWKLPDMFRFVLKDFGSRQLPRHKMEILKKLDLLYRLCKIEDWQKRPDADKIVLWLKRMAAKYDISLKRPTNIDHLNLLT